MKNKESLNIHVWILSWKFLISFKFEILKTSTHSTGKAMFWLYLLAELKDKIKIVRFLQRHTLYWGTMPTYARLNLASSSQIF